MDRIISGNGWRIITVSRAMTAFWRLWRAVAENPVGSVRPHRHRCVGQRPVSLVAQTQDDNSIGFQRGRCCTTSRRRPYSTEQYDGLYQ